MANVIVELTVSKELMKLGEDLIAALRGRVPQETVIQGTHTNEGVSSEIRRPEITLGGSAEKISEDKLAAAKADPTPSAASSAPSAGASNAPVKSYKLEEVRAKLGELSKAGKNIKNLIQSFGVRKLTDIPAEKYAEVMEKAGEL